MTSGWMMRSRSRERENTKQKGDQPCHPSYISVSGTNSVGTCLRSSRDRGRSAGRTLFFCGGSPPVSVASKPPPSEPPRSMAERYEWHAAAVSHARCFALNRCASVTYMCKRLFYGHFGRLQVVTRIVVSFGLVEDGMVLACHYLKWVGRGNEYLSEGFWELHMARASPFVSLFLHSELG